MFNSKELLKQANIIPKLRLGMKVLNEETGKESVVGTGPHRVKILEDKPVKAKNHKGVIIPVMSYIFEENGEKRQYNVPIQDDSGNLHYLIQRLSEVQEGEEVILEMKKKGIKNYVNVSSVGDDIEVGDQHDDLEGIIEQ